MYYNIVHNIYSNFHLKILIQCCRVKCQLEIIHKSVLFDLLTLYSLVKQGIQFDMLNQIQTSFSKQQVKHRKMILN